MSLVRGALDMGRVVAFRDYLNVARRLVLSSYSPSPRLVGVSSSSDDEFVCL